MKNLKNRKFNSIEAVQAIARIINRIMPGADVLKVLAFARQRSYTQKVPYEIYTVKVKLNHLVRALKRTPPHHFRPDEEETEPRPVGDYVSIFIRDSVTDNQDALSEIKGETVVCNGDTDITGMLDFLPEDVNPNSVRLSPKDKGVVYMDFITIDEADQLPEEEPNNAKYLWVLKSVTSGDVVFWLGLSTEAIPSVMEVADEINRCYIRAESTVEYPSRGRISYSDSMKMLQIATSNAVSNFQLGSMLKKLKFSDNPVGAKFTVEVYRGGDDFYNQKFQPQYNWEVTGGDLNSPVFLVSNKPYLEPHTFEKVTGCVFSPMIFPNPHDFMVEEIAT